MLNRRLPLFPITTTVADHGRGPALTIAGCDLADLADTYGTPLYLYDQATLDAAADTLSCRAWRGAIPVPAASPLRARRC